LLGAILPDVRPPNLPSFPAQKFVNIGKQWDQQDHYDYTAEENRLVEDVDQDDSGEDWDD